MFTHKKGPNRGAFSVQLAHRQFLLDEELQIQIKPHLTHSIQRQEMPFNVAIVPGPF